MENDNEKIIKHITTKIKDGQVILMLQNVYWFNPQPIEAKLVITSKKLYFVVNTSIKKYFQAEFIECVILSPFCSELVLYYGKSDHSSQQSIRIQSVSNVKIIQHIIIVREKFNEVKDKLMVMISSTKNLQSIANLNQNTNKSKLFGFLFKKKEDQKDLQQRISGQGQVLHVTYNNFALQIGQKMYNQIYKDIKLLYISSNQTFRFQQQKFDVQEINSTKKIFRPRPAQSPIRRKSSQSSINVKVDYNKFILLRKIGKVSNQLDKRVADHLKKYRNEQYKQQLLYALQTETHFQVLTSIYQGQKSCQQYLQQHQFLSEKDLRSILFKLIEMMQNTHQIFYSLSPQHIIMGKDGIRISEIFSCLKKRSQIDYISPQQLKEDQFNENQIQLINLWKTGILLFQLAYGNVPFPVQFIVNRILMNQTQYELNFPSYSLRTQQFQNFIKSLLKINPNKRGKTQQQNNKNGINCINSEDWKSALLTMTWLKYK